MGGDGGVIASDRRYMRGAGNADHTGDSNRASKAAIAEAEREAQVEAMTTCALTGSSFVSDNYKHDIVACPLGRLYNRESIVEVLLRLKLEQKGKEASTSTETKDVGWHIRGLKDLYPVRFQLTKKMSNGKNTRVPICPIINVELNGIQPAILIVSKKKKKKDKQEYSEERNGPNVLSEKAIKEMGIDALQEEYGPFEKNDMIKLAPSPSALKELKATLKEKYAIEKAAKKSSKKKRKKDDTSSNNEGIKKICINISDNASSSATHSSKKIKAKEVKTTQSISDVRNNVQAAVASNSVLSDLFRDKQAHLSEKEKKDKLFASNC